MKNNFIRILPTATKSAAAKHSVLGIEGANKCCGIVPMCTEFFFFASEFYTLFQYTAPGKSCRACLAGTQ